MKVTRAITDSIYRSQKLIAIVAIFFAFTAVGFRFGYKKNEWLWSDFPIIAPMLIAISLGLILIWMKFEKAKIQRTIENIKSNQTPREKLYQLTNRQLQVFELIVAGKSNSEIKEILFIEFSTLKSHINRIYKTLEISNRKEARKFQSAMIEKNPPWSK